MTQSVEDKTKSKITKLLRNGGVKYQYSFFFNDGEYAREFIPDLRKKLRAAPYYQITLARVIDDSNKKRPKNLEPQLYLTCFTQEFFRYEKWVDLERDFGEGLVFRKKTNSYYSKAELSPQRVWELAKRIQNKPLDDFTPYLGEGHNLKRVTEINKDKRSSQIVPLPPLPRKNSKDQDWKDPLDPNRPVVRAKRGPVGPHHDTDDPNNPFRERAAYVKWAQSLPKP